MRRARTRQMTRLLAWTLLSGVVLAAGSVALVGGIAAFGAFRTGNLPGELQRHAWLSVATTVLEQALAPLWAATLAMCAGGVSAALLQPRFAWRPLAPSQKLGDNSGFGFGVNVLVNP